MKYLIGLASVIALWLSVPTLVSSLIISGEYAGSALFDELLKWDATNPAVMAHRLRSSADPDERMALSRHFVSREQKAGIAWAELFAEKVRQREIDEELRSAFDNAMFYGPFDPAVEEHLLRSALNGWLILDGFTRSRVVDLAHTSLLNRAVHRLDTRRALVLNAGLLPLVCARYKTGCPEG